MRLIDRIALNRAIKLLSDFIIKLIEVLNRKNQNNTKPKPKPQKIRPIKKIIDTIMPWRSK